jgi:peptide/nickel transport system substrate-binding protein
LNLQKGKFFIVMLLLAGSAFGIALYPIHVQAVTSGTTLNVGLNRFATIPSLNPYAPVYVNPIDSEMYLRCIYNSYAPAAAITLQLCNSWSENSNDTSFTLNLLPGLKWSNGSPLNATDLSVSLADANATGYFVPTLTSIKIVNATAVTFTEPTSQPNLIASDLPNVFIVPAANFAHVAGGNISSYTAFTNIIGAGPYILPSYTAGTNPLIMVPNPYYYQGNQQYYSQIAVHIYSSLQAMESAMLSGAINIMWTSGTAQDLTPFTSASGISSYSFPVTDEYETIPLNYQVAPLNNQDFRQGLAYATNRSAIAATVYGAGSTLISYGLGNSPAPGEQEYATNITAAEQLFVKAGLKEVGSQLQYSNGTQVSLTIQFPSGDPDSQNVATLLSQQWAKVGIQLNTQLTDATTLYARFASGAWQVAAFTEDGISYDSCCHFIDTLQSSGGVGELSLASPGPTTKASDYITSQLGELIDNWTVSTIGSSQANALALQIEPLVAQQVPVIPLYTQADLTIYSSNLYFGVLNKADAAASTGIYQYQNVVQQPYAPSTFYVARPLSAASNFTVSSSGSTTASTNSTAVSSSSSPSVSTTATNSTAVSSSSSPSVSTTTTTAVSTSSASVTSTTTTTAVSTSTSSSSSTASSSTALNSSIFPVVTIAALAIAVGAVVTASRRRSRVGPAGLRKVGIA